MQDCSSRCNALLPYQIVSFHRIGKRQATACSFVSQAQKAELQFSLLVEGKGTVAGALYYFPYEHERETVPMEHAQSAVDDPASSMALPQPSASSHSAISHMSQQSHGEERKPTLKTLL